MRIVNLVFNLPIIFRPRSENSAWRVTISMFDFRFGNSDNSELLTVLSVLNTQELCGHVAQLESYRPLEALVRLRQAL